MVAFLTCARRFVILYFYRVFLCSVATLPDVDALWKISTRQEDLFLHVRFPPGIGESSFRSSLCHFYSFDIRLMLIIS